MSDVHHEATICIPAGHPCLPGHFPGRPIVPGVVLLDAVAAALERWRGVRIAGFAQVKFLRPLLPEQQAVLTLGAVGAGIRFDIVYNGAAIAGGSLEVRA